MAPKAQGEHEFAGLDQEVNGYLSQDLEGRTMHPIYYVPTMALIHMHSAQDVKCIAFSMVAVDKCFAPP